MSGITIDGLRWEVRTRGAGPAAMLLLHGFTGRGTSWGTHAGILATAFRVVVVDLPGHGRSGYADPARMTVERTADDLAAILARLDAVPAHALGYSLGARIALRLAVSHPAAVASLVLESPSAGIADDQERAVRRAADEALADGIERDGIDAFVTAWERSPVFATHAALPAALLARQRAIRLSNDPRGLAASLRGAGRGAMEPLHDRLPGIDAPTLVIGGALDAVGRPRAELVAGRIPGARLELLARVGHTPHLERPPVFRRLALDFLQEVSAA